tara:strand:- start:2516 stop:3913 length:1398 start_codon:yes stop_codon:yes gene_type:complete
MIRKILYLSAIIFVLISITLLFFFIFKSEVVYNGENRNYYLNYYWICIILIIFSIVCLKYYYNPYWLITLLTIVFSLYSFQFYYIYNHYEKVKYFNENFNSNEKRINLFEKNNSVYDTRNRKEIYEQEVLRNENKTINITPKLFISEDDLLPLSGLPNKITIYCNENGYYAEYLSDRHGFNNPDEEWDKSKNKVIALGDSFINGACVNRPYDLVSVLRKNSDKKNLAYLNLGMDSNGPGFQLATLKEYHTKETEFILWFYYENNDLAEVERDSKNIILQKYLNQPNFKQNLSLNQRSLNQKINKKIQDEYKKIKEEKIKEEKIKEEKIKEEYKLIIKYSDFIKFKYLRSQIHLNENKHNLEKYKGYLAEAKNFATKKGSKLIFIFLPEFGRYNFNYRQRDKNYVEIIKLVNELDIDIIDLNTKLFLKQENPNIFFPFGMSGHYNKEGYSKAAEIINIFLNKKNYN